MHTKAALALLLAIVAPTAACAHDQHHAKAPVTVARDQAAMLASADPKLAANKRLVYDMYRVVLQAGRTDLADRYIAKDYIQHNPTAAQGLAGLVDYVRLTRPQRLILDQLELPVIHMIAEGDYVTIAFVRPEKDAKGEPYVTTWFDLFRIEGGKIVEHWDPMLKTDTKIDPNDQKLK